MAEHVPLQPKPLHILRELLHQGKFHGAEMSLIAPPLLVHKTVEYIAGHVFYDVQVQPLAVAGQPAVVGVPGVIEIGFICTYPRNENDIKSSTAIRIHNR